jgi:hypothetical protein
MVFVE